MSWVLEDNAPMRRLPNPSAQSYKTYRIYEDIAG